MARDGRPTTRWQRLLARPPLARSPASFSLRSARHGSRKWRWPLDHPNISRSIFWRLRVSWHGGSPPIKTLVSLAIGFALAAVGIDTVSGSVRLTMGIDELVKGVSFVVAVMGLFGIGELDDCGGREFHVKTISSKVEWREVFRTLAGLPKYGWALLRSAAIGCWMALHREADRRIVHELRDRQAPFAPHANFGKGEPEGIVAPEAADHAAGTSALLPMLSLGIPGSPPLPS